MLPGIQEILARRIVDDRNAQGPFRTVDDLLRVPGIGPQKLQSLRPWLIVSQPIDSGHRLPAGAERCP
jgi:competence protein ComEA